jgi:hypothetical protein
MPRISVFISGTGLLETYFTALPYFVVKHELTPSHMPISLVVVIGDVVLAEVISRRCSVCSNWKWEALPHMDM